MKKNFGFLQKAFRAITFNSPFRKGKYRLALIALKLDGDPPTEVLAMTKDDRRLLVDPTSISYQFVYFLGEYEPAITEVIETVVDKGDTCLDIGGNIGWYTTLLQKKVGDRGQVHSFEPVPQIFEKLKKNVALNNDFGAAVTVNNLALGNEEKTVEMHIFKDMPDGHSSIATFGSSDSEIVTCPMITLSSYLEDKQIDEVNFVKMDIEGAEMMMLQGADRLFAQLRPPIWEIEMALDTTRGFGYLPNDLIRFISERAEYDFFAIDEQKFCIRQIAGFADTEPGANVLCVPKDHYRDRLARLKISD